MEVGAGFDAVAWINTPRWQASRLGLSRMVDLLERLGRPQDALRFVHVAGTNGKGSTCAYLAAMLQAAGYKTGLFTSPFIECFEERIRVDGANITPEELGRAAAVVRPAAEAVEAATGDHPTEFELMAAVALEHFRAVGCDIVVLEVGLGGRLDATNVIDAPEASVICRIGLDHTDLLGDTLALVAAEKAGIVKPGAPVVSWPQEPEALEVVAAAAVEHGCSLTVPDFSQLKVAPLRGREGAGGRRDGAACDQAATGGDQPAAAISHDAGAGAPLRRFTYRGIPYETQLLGSYQPYNAALALETVRVLNGCGWNIPVEAQQAGIAEARWPGRFEVVAQDPLTIIDGGHNPQGAQALADSLADVLGEEGRGSVIFVMGVLADKDYPAMAAAIAPWARGVVTYTPPNPRALSAEELAAHLRQAHSLQAQVAPSPAEALRQAHSLQTQVAPSPAEALRWARALAAEADGKAETSAPVVAFGTLYAIADLRHGLE